MSITIEDSKRTAIASKLADMKEIQNLLISNEEKLMMACNDQELRARFGKMLDDDRKNFIDLTNLVRCKTKPH